MGSDEEDNAAHNTQKQKGAPQDPRPEVARARFEAQSAQTMIAQNLDAKIGESQELQRSSFVHEQLGALANIAQPGEKIEGVVNTESEAQSAGDNQEALAPKQPQEEPTAVEVEEETKRPLTPKKEDEEPSAEQQPAEDAQGEAQVEEEQPESGEVLAQELAEEAEVDEDDDDDGVEIMDDDEADSLLQK